VLGRKNLYCIVDVNVNGGVSLPGFGINTGWDSAMQELRGIQGIAMSIRVGMHASYVSICLPFGSPFAKSGRNKDQSTNAYFIMLVDEPEKAARLIREAKEKLYQLSFTPIVVEVPVNAAVPVNTVGLVYAVIMERPLKLNIRSK